MNRSKFYEEKMNHVLRLMDNLRIVLADLDKLYATAQERKIRVVLLIFPFTFQLANSTFIAKPKITDSHLV